MNQSFFHFTGNGSFPGPYPGPDKALGYPALEAIGEAGADFFIMPSRYEPSGLNQMFSLKYGTLPIVRRTGGLADSVEPFDPGNLVRQVFGVRRRHCVASGPTMR